MALTRTKKAELIEQYQGGLAQAPHAFLVGFKGLTVPQATELRNRIRSTGGCYEVVKNTLALRAIDGKGLAELGGQFRGPTAVAYCEDDAVSLAKALMDFRKEVPVLEFKGGLVDGQAVDAGQLEEIARLPAREDLVARLLYLMQSPITRLARSLAAIPRQLVVVLDQVAKQQEGSNQD